MLRLLISEADYGRNKEVTCPICEAKCQILITDQKKFESLVQNLSSAMTEAVLESSEVLEARQALNKAGYMMKISFFGEFALVSQQEPTRSVQPKVRDGEVELGTFSSEDTDWAKELNIRLDE